MSFPRERITYQDYLLLPEGGRWEVLEGDLRMVPSPGERHQRTLFRLSYTLATQVDVPGVGKVYVAPFDVILDEDTVVQPDLLVILKDRLSIVQPEGVRGAPDLVVEVLSPGTAAAARDRSIKRRLYGRYGVQEYWIVDPEARTVEVAVNRGGSLETHGLFAAGSRVASLLLPGLDVMVEAIFTEGL